MPAMPDFVVPGQQVLWCAPARPTGTLPPCHTVTVLSIYDTLVLIDIPTDAGYTLTRLVPVVELFPNPRAAE